MISCKLEWNESDLNLQSGWRLSGRCDFFNSPLIGSGGLLFHDLIEHAEHPNLEGEIAAFGAMYVTSSYEYSSGSRRLLRYGLSSAIESALDLGQNLTLYDSPKVILPFFTVDGVPIDRALKVFSSQILQTPSNRCPDSYVARRILLKKSKVLGWLRVGVYDLIHKYHRESKLILSQCDQGLILNLEALSHAHAKLKDAFNLYFQQLDAQFVHNQRGRDLILRYNFDGLIEVVPHPT